MRKRVLGLLVVVALSSGCGREGAGARAPGTSAPTASRRYRLASAGVQAFPGAALLYQTTPADLAADADVVAIRSSSTSPRRSSRCGARWGSAATTAPRSLR